MMVGYVMNNLQACSFFPRSSAICVWWWWWWKFVWWIFHHICYDQRTRQMPLLITLEHDDFVVAVNTVSRKIKLTDGASRMIKHRWNSIWSWDWHFSHSTALTLCVDPHRINNRGKPEWDFSVHFFHSIFHANRKMRLFSVQRVHRLMKNDPRLGVCGRDMQNAFDGIVESGQKGFYGALRHEW